MKLFPRLPSSPFVVTLLVLATATLACDLAAADLVETLPGVSTSPANPPNRLRGNPFEIVRFLVSNKIEIENRYRVQGLLDEARWRLAPGASMTFDVWEVNLAEYGGTVTAITPVGQPQLLPGNWRRVKTGSLYAPSQVTVTRPELGMEIDLPSLIIWPGDNLGDLAALQDSALRDRRAAALSKTRELARRLSYPYSNPGPEEEFADELRKRMHREIERLAVMDREIRRRGTNPANATAPAARSSRPPERRSAPDTRELEALRAREAARVRDQQRAAAERERLAQEHARLDADQRRLADKKRQDEQMKVWKEELERRAREAQRQRAFEEQRQRAEQLRREAYEKERLSRSKAERPHREIRDRPVRETGSPSSSPAPHNEPNWDHVQKAIDRYVEHLYDRNGIEMKPGIRLP